jgi:hypothetical protein
MLTNEWILDNLGNYITSIDVELRHGWFEFKVDNVINFLDDAHRSLAMDKIESLIAKPYLKAVGQRNENSISESEYWSKVARYTDVFQILRNIRSKYNLPNSTLLNE